MLIAYGHLFASAMDDIDWVCALAQADPTGTAKKNVASEGLCFARIDLLLQNVEFLAKECEMRSVNDQRLRISKMIAFNRSLGELAPEFTQLRVRIQEDLTRKEFLFVSEESAQLYNESDPRRGAVKGTDPFQLGNKFKKAHADIASAGRCLAIGEGTACVMHLSRALETCVQNLSRRLNITVTPQTPWRHLTGRMADEIKKMNNPAKAKKKNDWEDASVNLHHVGSVWRNKNMHPAEHYTPSQAKDVFDACRVFMTSLCRL